jgi:hypothetical protein
LHLESVRHSWPNKESYRAGGSEGNVQNDQRLDCIEKEVEEKKRETCGKGKHQH